MEIYGLLLDEQTRCKHYHSDDDIIAIQMYCCGKFYACIDCHNAMEEHQTKVWPVELQDREAVYCGSCKKTMTSREYLKCNNTCPTCSAAFNAGCAKHYHLYFERKV